MDAMSVQISPRKFVTFDKNPHQAVINCPSSEKTTDETITAYGLSAMEVPPNCFIKTDNYVLYGAEQAFDREWDISWSWPQGWSHLVKDINFTDVNALMQEEHSPVSNKSRFALSLAREALHHLPHRAPLAASTTSWLTLISTPTGLLLLCGFIAMLYWKKRHSLTPTNQPSTSVQVINTTNAPSAPTSDADRDLLSKKNNLQMW